MATRSVKDQGASFGHPVVSVIVDSPGWAHDFKTRQLASILRDEFLLRTVYQNQTTTRDLHDADLVLVYYWYQVLQVENIGQTFASCKNKPLLGICSHFEVDGPERKKALDVLSRIAGAVFVNNLSLYHEFYDHVRLPFFYTPNGVDTSFFRPATTPARFSERTFRVGWAGSLTNQGRAHRGFDEFIVPAVASVKGADLSTAVREDRLRSKAEMRAFYRSLDVYLCASES